MRIFNVDVFESYQVKSNQNDDFDFLIGKKSRLDFS